MSIDPKDMKNSTPEPGELAVLWPGRPEPISQCDHPCLTHFATIIDEWPRFDSLDDIDTAMNLVPKPADLAPWIMRLPEFVCHVCQGQPVRGAYFYQMANLSSMDETLFCPKEYAIAAMDERVILTGVSPQERRQREAMHLARTVLGIEVASAQVTVSHSGVYDVTAVWQSQPPVECPVAKVIWDMRDKHFAHLREDLAFKIQADLWQVMEPEIKMAIRRLCPKRGRGIALGVFHGVPALCLDCVPMGFAKEECGEICLRHPVVVASEKRAFTQLGLEVDEGLLATCAQMVNPLLEQLLQKQLTANDYPALPSREKLLERGPGFGASLPFTVSGLTGQHYSITETDVDRNETNAAEELLHKMLSESAKTGWLHHFHATLAFGRFNSDPRPAAEIPEAALWVRKLHERFPALWFFLDPDSLSWFYPAMYPDSVSKAGVRIEPRNYARLCIRATSAAVEQFRACGCRVDRLNSLLSQAATVKNFAARNNFPDVRFAARSQFDAFLAQADNIPGNLLHAGKFAREVITEWVFEKAATSYNDGQVHGAALTGPFNEGRPDSYFVFSFFPCSSMAAQNSYQQSGGYRKALLQMRSSDVVTRLSILHGIESLIHLVVCHELFFKYSFHLTILPWEASEPAYTAPAFRACL